MTFNNNKAEIATGFIQNTQSETTKTYKVSMWIDEDAIFVSSTTKRETLPEGNPSMAVATSGNVTATRYMKNDNTDPSTVTLYPARSEAQGKIIYTTYEFSHSYYSVKIVVEAQDGQYAVNPMAYQLLNQNADTTTLINFANISSSSNGEGLYMLPGTGNNTYPIYYYRGAVTNNNVIFGDYCWQMVRTTDTGGIKMIYNGEVTGTSAAPTCENTAHADRIISSSTFNSNYESASDVGYMSNTRYAFSTSGWTTDALFASSATWVTDHYELTDASVTTPNATHHYSCNATTASATCTDLRYVFYVSGTTKYYIALTNGELIEDALYKMTGNGSSTTKQNNSGYVLNQNNSTIKGVIDTWFETNLTNVVDNTKTDYRPYLEDTIYCNDRSYKTESGSIATYEQSGWNPNTSG